MRGQHASTVRFRFTVNVGVMDQDEPLSAVKIGKGQQISGVITCFQHGRVEMFDITEASGRTFTNIPYRMIRFVD